MEGLDPPPAVATSGPPDFVTEHYNPGLATTEGDDAHWRGYLVVLGIVLVVAFVVAALLGWKPLAAEPNYTVWCDSTWHLVIVQGQSGGIGVAPAPQHGC